MKNLSATGRLGKIGGGAPAVATGKTTARIRGSGGIKAPKSNVKISLPKVSLGATKGLMAR